MEQKTKELIEKYIADFDIEGQEDYSNIIPAAANEGIDILIDLRNVIKESGIKLNTFDKQLAEMIANSKKILEISKIINN